MNRLPAFVRCLAAHNSYLATSVGCTATQNSRLATCCNIKKLLSNQTKKNCDFKHCWVFHSNV